MSSVPSVLVIMDGEFGDQLASVSLDSPIWIVDSATNVSITEELRRVGRGDKITTFRYNPLISGSEALAGILPTVDLHHGPLSEGRPYRRLEVVGARPNHVVTSALADIGFRLDNITRQGFTAVALEAV